MQASAPAPFEVHCDRCRVTFPVGTRRCIHCGGPTGVSARKPGLRFEPMAAPPEVPDESDPELAKHRFISPLTLVWIALIAAGYLVRACSGQGP